jgi:hypothetical protein
MGNSNGSIPSPTRFGSYAICMLYVLPVLFGAMAACAGGIAWHRPATGLCMMVFALVGYIAASVPLVRVIETMRAERVRPVISLVREGPRGQSGGDRNEVRHEVRPAALRVVSR